MKQNRTSSFMLGLVLIRVGVLTGIALVGAHSEAGAAENPDYSTQEAQMLEEDHTAEEAFLSSITRLNQIIHTRQNTPQEAALLTSLSETLNQLSAIQFRLLHAHLPPAEVVKKKEAYQKTLTQTLQVTSRLLEKYKTPESTPRNLYLRARALTELGRDAEAIQDLKNLIDHFPKDPLIPKAEFSLHDLLTQHKDYVTAISYLQKFRPSPQEPYYALYLDHLGHDYYAINNIPQALYYLEAELAILPEEDRSRPIQSCVLFYFTGMSTSKSTYTAAGLIPYLKKIKAGKHFSKSLKYFTQLLRSQGRNADIEILKRFVFQEKLPLADLLNFLTAVFEHEVDKKSYTAIAETINLLTPLSQQLQSEPAFMGLMATTATALQNEIRLHSNVALALKVDEALIAIFKLLLNTSKDPKIMQEVRFNLAELYLLTKHYENAVFYFLIVIEKNSAETTKPEILAKSKSDLILARYSSLSERQIFPKELKAHSMDSSVNKNLDPLAAEWIKWLEQEPSADPFYSLEAARLLYSSSGQMQKAMDLLNALVEKDISLDPARVAAFLLIDTYLLSEKWSHACELAENLIKKLELKKADPKNKNASIDATFKSKLETVDAEADFKWAEELFKKKSYQEVLQKAELLIKKYPTQKHQSETVALAGHSALALQDKAKANYYFGMLIQLKPNDSLSAPAYLTQAASAEENWNYDAAAKSFMTILKLSSRDSRNSASNDELTQYRKKVLLYFWLSGQSENLRKALADPAICTPNITASCQEYTLLVELMPPYGLGAHKSTPSKTQAGLSGLEKLIQAALLLKNAAPLAHAARLKQLEVIGTEWNSQNSLVQYTLLPLLISSLPSQIQQAGNDIRNQAKLSLDKKYIDHRVQMIDQLESIIQKLIAFPVAQTQVKLFHEWAVLYLSFAEDLGALGKKLGGSPEEKQIIETTLNELKTPLIAKAADIQKKGDAVLVDSRTNTQVTSQFGLGLLESLQTSQAGLKPWLEAWKKALQNKNWPTVVYLMQDAQERNAVPAATLAIARALSLDSVGARTEAWTQWKEAARLNDEPLRKQITEQMLSNPLVNSLTSPSPEKGGTSK